MFVAGTLNAHHLDSYHDHKELRYDINNGITLCKSCHREFHKYIGGNNVSCSREDYENFKIVKAGA